MKFNKGKAVLFIPAVIAIIAAAFLLVKGSSTEENIITGIIETTEVDVASKIPGRIDSLFVKEGDYVQKGQILAKLESKEMDAKLEQGRGVMEAARAKMNMAHNGARPEEIEATKKLYEQASHQFELAEKTWKRIQSLYKDQVISTQEKDQVEFQYKAAREQMEAAKAKYDMVKKGARIEEIMGAEGLFHQAENAYNEAAAYYKELTITSPISGEISKKISDQGEIIASGYPLFTLINPNDNWVVLQVREDQLGKLKKGAAFWGRIPALENQKCEFEVVYISPMADFATWKPTNQKGEFDLKTFEIHLRSKQPIKGLRAGMSVNIIL